MIKTRTTVLLSLLASTALAHFDIAFPEGKTPDDENTLTSGPCGGAKLDFDAGPVNDFHVGGNAVLLSPSHPQQKWLFRVTTDTTGFGNWTKAYPILLQSGLGDVCIPMVTAPEDFVGKKGLLGVVADAEDGVLYGCSQVNFVEGTGNAPDDCKNGTKNINFDSDDTLEVLASGSGGASGSGNSSGSSSSGTGSSNAPKETESPGLAASLRSGPAGLGGVLATVSVAILVGVSMML